MWELYFFQSGSVRQAIVVAAAVLCAACGRPVYSCSAVGDAFRLVQAHRPKFGKHPMSTPFSGDEDLESMANVFYESPPSR